MPQNESLMGAARLTAELESLAGDVAQRPAHTGFGRILPGFDLYIYGFRGSADAPITVKVGRWYCARSLTLPLTTMTVTDVIGIHDHAGGQHGGHSAGDGGHVHEDSGAHQHVVVTPRALARLKVGDVVSVVWIDGAVPYVEDVVVSSSLLLNTAEAAIGGYTGTAAPAQVGGDAGGGGYTGPTGVGSSGGIYITAPGDTWASVSASTGITEAALQAHLGGFGYPQPFAPGTVLGLP